MVLWESPRQCSSWTLCEGFCWLLLLPVTLLIIARPVKLAAFPTSLSDCQTPTGWNCSGKSRSSALHPFAPQKLGTCTDLPIHPRASAQPLAFHCLEARTSHLHPEKHWELLQPGLGVLGLGTK